MNSPEPPEDKSARHIWLIGAAALLAWLAMLWFMFGDVL